MTGGGKHSLGGREVSLVVVVTVSVTTDEKTESYHSVNTEQYVLTLACQSISYMLILVGRC